MDVANKNFKTPAEEKAEADKLVSEKLEADRKWQLEQEKLGQKDRQLDLEEKRLGINKDSPTRTRAKTQAQEKEADMILIGNQLQDELASGAKTPEDVYAEGYRMHDDGTLFTKRAVDDAGNIVGKAVELPDWTDATGKRGGVTALKAAGEYRDDAMQLRALLLNPQVASNLRKFKPEEDSDLWDRTKGTVENRVRTWATKHGISEDSPTNTALRRMQRMASEERKKFLGSAVTGTELKSTLGWMLDPRDSYDAMMNKINLIDSEADEMFRRHLNVYRNIANMADWYEEYGLNRFETGDVAVGDMSDDQLLKALSE
jgi:hypothetical protein